MFAIIECAATSSDVTIIFRKKQHHQKGLFWRRDQSGSTQRNVVTKLVPLHRCVRRNMELRKRKGRITEQFKAQPWPLHVLGSRRRPEKGGSDDLCK